MVFSTTDVFLFNGAMILPGKAERMLRIGHLLNSPQDVAKARNLRNTVYVGLTLTALTTSGLALGGIPFVFTACAFVIGFGLTCIPAKSSSTLLPLSRMHLNKVICLMTTSNG
jgi:hypothetical protein